MTKRTDMLGSVVREVIAPALRECPQACGIVSITRIEVSSDGSYATAFLSALQHPELALAFLQERKRDLQQKLGKLPRRKIPLLRFRLDRDLEKGNRIDALLRMLDE